MDVYANVPTIDPEAAIGCWYAYLMDSVESGYLNKALVLLVLGIGIVAFSMYRRFKGRR